MSETDKEIEKLDNEFNELLQLLEGFISSYDFRQKYIATEWLTKLKNSKASLDEKKLRNRFLKHFVKSHESGVRIFCSDPFNNIPKEFKEPLRELKKLLPKDPYEALNPTDDEKQAFISELFENLYDKGEFLAQQPVPRNGNFFILVFQPEKEITSCPNI